MKLPFNIGAPLNESLQRRKGRRKMAWIALYSILGLTLLLMFAVSETKIEALSSVIDTVFFCLSTIVLGYLGIATFDDSNVMKHKENMHCKDDKKNDKKKEVKVDDPDEEK
jgi:hypothetical protein